MKSESSGSASSFSIFLRFFWAFARRFSCPIWIVRTGARVAYRHAAMSLFDPFPDLDTPRLHLRAVTRADADDMFRVNADPEVLRFIGRPPPASIDVIVERIEGMIASTRAETGITWKLCDRATGAYAGGAGLKYWDKTHCRAEVGYILAREHWGRGLATEALAPILRFAFERMLLHSIEARVHPDNRASRRVLEKLGFVQEGYLRESYFNSVTGLFEDTVVYSRLSDA